MTAYFLGLHLFLFSLGMNCSNLKLSMYYFHVGELQVPTLLVRTSLFWCQWRSGQPLRVERIAGHPSLDSLCWSQTTLPRPLCSPHTHLPVSCLPPSPGFSYTSSNLSVNITISGACMVPMPHQGLAPFPCILENPVPDPSQILFAEFLYFLRIC
jgi:hypothetical protein